MSAPVPVPAPTHLLPLLALLCACSGAKVAGDTASDTDTTDLEVTFSDVTIDAEPDGGPLVCEPACGAATACDGGTCLPVVCAPGETRCDDERARAVCNATGTRFQREDCVFGVCVDGQCAAACIIGARRCEGQAVLECDDQHVEATVRICDSAAGELCAGGGCLSECDQRGAKHGYFACDFWAADLPNDISAIDNIFAFAFSNASARVATVTVTYPWGPVETLTVPIGGLAAHFLPAPRALSQIPGPGVGRYGFRIQSDQPIAAFMFNPLERYDATSDDAVATNDASLLIPAVALGTRYLAITWSDPGQFSGPPYVTVVATQDDTRIVVRPTETISLGQAPYLAPAGEYTPVVLQAYEALNLETKSSPNVRRDLTGTSITSSNHPIAVFSGNRCARVPDEGRFCDHLETQLPPLETWGDSFVVTKFTDRGGESDYFRVLAQEGDTHLVFDPPRAAPILVAGGMWEFSSQEGFALSTSRPVLLAQFMASQSMTTPPGPFGISPDCPSGTCQGDPSMVLAPPVAQWPTELIFLVPDTYAHQFINVAFSEGTELVLDGLPINTSGALTIGAEAWRTVVIPTGGGYRTLIASKPVGVVVYGYDHNISYAYNAGLDFKPLR